MSIAFISESIDYPESEGEPMGETDLHRDWMVRILEILRHRYRGQRVYIASDLLATQETTWRGTVRWQGFRILRCILSGPN